MASPGAHLVHLQGCQLQQLLHFLSGRSYLLAPPPGPVAGPALEGHALHCARHDGRLRTHGPSIGCLFARPLQSASVDTYSVSAFQFPAVPSTPWGSQSDGGQGWGALDHTHNQNTNCWHSVINTLC